MKSETQIKKKEKYFWIRLFSKGFNENAMFLRAKTFYMLLKIMYMWLIEHQKQDIFIKTSQKYLLKGLKCTSNNNPPLELFSRMG